MASLNYHDRYFQSIENSPNGEVSGKTVFHYRQEGQILWATYSGGSIIFGTITGKVFETGELEFSYQHVNTHGEIMTGKCKSIPHILEDGRIRLSEEWQWTCKDFSKGHSIVEEMPAKK